MALSSQPKPTCHVSLCEVLILVADVGRCVDEFYIGWPPHRRKYGVGKVEEGAGFSGTEVIYTAVLSVVHQVYAYLDHVLHIDEVAHLLSITIVGAVGAEKSHLSRSLDLLVSVPDHRRHSPLVVFIGTVDIEKF